uniref:F-box/LRR-repeat protein 15-like leucin rich repeat domain-containing protein n=1 Tax=Opuntia streptacantha TaxID=393608 RepID=A0A7C9D5J3_OPUST
MKKHRTSMAKTPSSSSTFINLFDLLSEEIIFAILDCLHNTDDRKSFSIVCKSFYSIESKHRRTLRPLRSEHLPSLLKRYSQISRLDLTLCPRITDASLSAVAGDALRSVDLSRSSFFTGNGLAAVVARCRNLVELDLSNATQIRDLAASAIAEAKNLERLWLERCKLITDIGIGCIAVGCPKLKLISLKWCLGIGDLGVELLAVKCKELRSLDLSYLPITSKCLPAILKLQYLEELILEGCFAIDDDGLAAFKLGSQSLKTLDLSSCQNVSQVGLSSLTTGTECLQQLTLAYGSAVTLDIARSLQKLSKLQSIKLDGCLVTSSGLQAIGNCCFLLRELSLSKCSGVTDEGLTSIVKKQKELRKLDITCCRKITYVSIAHIANSCTSLMSLRMESCTLVPREAFVLIGQRCHLLEELDLTDNEIDDEGLKSLSKCSKLAILKLGICLNITDEGLTHIGNKCSKLLELDLYRSMEITDSGVLAIARGCLGLEMINVSYCTEITDGSLMSLAKCAKLRTLECRGCPHVTSLGVAAIAVGCKRLTKLDIKKCYNVNNIGIIPLGHFSQNLRQINMSYTSTTDVGLLSLANIRCLQSMTILHMKGLSPRGLAAALLACGGLLKVKLHSSYKSLLPQPLLEHLEARGCVFQWREKVYQDEMEDSKSWKLQLEEMNNDS